jgi:SAM-dependent methyltransferase
MSKMTEFWEKAFIEKKEMWGFEPSNSTKLTNDFFKENSLKNILVPGFGYGRNAQLFKENGMEITGIEISKTAIEYSRKHYGNETTIHHGSVTDMPFDNREYDGIYAYGLIYLLDKDERLKFIQDCYSQLSKNGFMVFTVITKESKTYGTGTLLSKDRYEMFGGVKIFFYDKESIVEEFEKFGLLDVQDVNENFPFYLIKCKKE